MDALESLQREHLLLKWMVADLKLDLLRREFARKGGFNPDQPRDEVGRWTSDGGEATVRRASASQNDARVVPADYVRIPVNANQAVFILSHIQTEFPDRFRNGEIAASGVERGTWRRNADGTIEVTNGDVLSLTHATNTATRHTVLGDHVATIEIDGTVTIGRRV